MKSVSTAFKTAWGNKYSKRRRDQVWYKRRYWNGSAFVYESNWQILDQGQFSQTGDVQQNLDTDYYSVFNSTQVTLMLDNGKGQWFVNGTSGSLLGPDSVATNGYVYAKMMFQINRGYELADGTFEYVPLYTGYFVDFQPTSDSNVIGIITQDGSFLMDTADAELVADEISSPTDCTATGDGTTTKFITTDTGIYYLTAVYVNAVLIDPSLWSVSNTGQTTGAEIDLLTAPSGGQAVSYTGWKWKQNEAIETLVALLADQSGIGSGQQNIVPVLFPGVSGDETINTQALWEALGATLSNIDASEYVNSIIQAWSLVDDFSEGNLNKWTVDFDPNGAPSVSSGNAVLPGTTGMHTAFTGNYGSYRYIWQGSGGLDLLLLTSLSVEFDAYTGSTGYYFRAVDNQVQIGLLGVSDSSASVTISAGDELIMTFSSSGDFAFYINGVQVLTFHDTAYSSFSYLALWNNTGANASLTGIYYSTSFSNNPWFIIDDFSDGNYTSDPAWSISGGSGFSFSVASSQLEISVSDSTHPGTIYTASTRAGGSWDFEMDAGTGGSGGNSCEFWFMCNTIVAAGGESGYSVKINGTTITLNLYNGASATALITGSITAAIFHEIRVTLDSSSHKFELDCDGVSIGTATDSTNTTSTYVAFTSQSGNGGASFLTNIYFTGQVISGSTAVPAFPVNTNGEWTSPEYDLLSTPSSFGTLGHTEILNGGTVAYYVATHSTAGQPYLDADFVALGAGDAIEATPEQYMAVRVVITPAAGSYTSPQVEEVIVNFTLSTLTITVANHDQKTCWDMAQRYAQVASYETGFDAYGNFFFRPKTVSASPVMSFSQADVITKVSNHCTGKQNIYTAAVVSYGGNKVTYDCAAASLASPNTQDENGRIIRTEDLSDILLANDAGIATARAQAIFNQKSQPKRVATLECKIVPWLDLSDVVSVTFVNSPAQLDNIAGDPLQAPGYAGADPNVLFMNMIAKIIGIAYKPDTDAGQIVVEEVLP